MLFDDKLEEKENDDDDVCVLMVVVLFLFLFLFLFLLLLVDQVHKFVSRQRHLVLQNIRCRQFGLGAYQRRHHAALLWVFGSLCCLLFRY